MPKGMFTQGLCVLLESPTTLDAMAALLGEFDVRRRVDEQQEWAFSGPSLIVAYLPDINGLVQIDVVDHRWPDEMGDPQGDSAMVFGAWSMGFFGPLTFPGGLSRAAEQSWSWEEAKSVVAKHRAFLRIRASYALGGDGNSPVIPQGYEPLPELEFVTKIAAALLKLPGALCYFNPNGEVLRDADGLRETLNYAWSHDLVPLDAWTNVRMFNIDAEWSLMDTVGNGQLDIPDIEACFHTESYDFNQVANFLRNVSLYILKNGDVIRDNDTMDGPGGIHWQAISFKNGICTPPRATLRWVPTDDREIPEIVATSGAEESEPEA